jgi:hypothetical protein
MTASLDMLLLILVDEGLNTPYRWQKESGISLGASLPAVRRLLARHLVSEAPTGPRLRREFAITRTGRSELKHLDQYLDSAPSEPIGDLESVLRLFSIAVYGGRQDVARRLLQDAAAEYDRRVARAQKRAAESAEQTGTAAFYMATTSHCEANRLQTMASGLRFLLSHFGKVRPSKSGTSRKPAKTQH